MKYLPFTKEQIEKIAAKHPTPFHLYDEHALRENARRFIKAFSILPGFMQYFAVKACPNPFIMEILKQEGFGADCSSMPELTLAERTGITGEKIMFTSNDTAFEEFVKAKELGAVINADDITHLPYLEKHAGLPELLCFRYNPGEERGADKSNIIIGNPVEAKYGMTKPQLFEAFRWCKAKGIKRFGIHTMVVSNELNENNLVLTATMMFKLAHEIKDTLSIDIEFINLGGGFGIPYKLEDKALDYAQIAHRIKEEYDLYLTPFNLKPKIFTECGRIVTGPYGYLVSRVRHIKKTYKNYLGLDATMADLMRPGMYGAYHHITVLGKENQPATQLYDVTGSLCENNDKFAVNRNLPEVSVGDILAIHDTGAHGYAMGFNYNGKLRSAELLLRETGHVLEIRRAETSDDYFATLDFEKLKKFEAA